MEWKSNRRLLIIGAPKPLLKEGLVPHETLHAKTLEGAFGPIASARPDLVIYFAKNNDDLLEEQVLTWLIEGFYGKFLLFDPFNRVKDSPILLHSQVVDDYFSGPVGTDNFISIIKHQLSQNSNFAQPRAMTTFDLFRNLFERGLNAIFFFDQDLKRCVAANLCAEQITGMSLSQLRRSGLRDLCKEEEFEAALRIIRRAGRHYYDSRGTMGLKNTHGLPVPVSFSCGVFGFGRKNFVKVEVQGTAPPAEKIQPAREDKRQKKSRASEFHTHA